MTRARTLAILAGLGPRTVGAHVLPGRGGRGRYGGLPEAWRRLAKAAALGPQWTNHNELLGWSIARDLLGDEAAQAPKCECRLNTPQKCRPNFPQVSA